MPDRDDKFILNPEDVTVLPAKGAPPRHTLTAQELEEARARVAAGEDVDVVAAEIAKRKAEEGQ
jgi:hypothetical protein